MKKRKRRTPRRKAYLDFYENWAILAVPVKTIKKHRTKDSIKEETKSKEIEAQSIAEKTEAKYIGQALKRDEHELIWLIQYFIVENQSLEAFKAACKDNLQRKRKTPLVIQ